MEAPEHTCVKRLCHIWDELIYGRFLCAKGHNPLPTLSSLSTSPSPRHSSLIALLFQGERKQQQNTWSCSTFSAGQDRVLPRDKVACQHLAHRAQPIWKAPTASTPTCVPNGPLHCRNEYVPYVRKKGMFPSPLCMKHKERVGMFGKAEGGWVGGVGVCSRGKAGRGGGRGSNLRGGGYPTMQIKHMVRTLCCGRRETNRRKTESFTQLHYDLKKGLTSPMKATRPRD